jgi:regulator of cell morphogenesis and NO signaling
MTITEQSTVAEVATALPATIRIFQEHGIDFCCGGKLPLADACAAHGVDAGALITELQAATASDRAVRNWEQAALKELIAHVQARFHVPLRTELPRLAAMMAKVVSRHGERHPEVLLPLARTFEHLSRELMAHMGKEDAVLFPAVIEIERGLAPSAAAWIAHPIAAMEADHEDAGRALAEMRRLTSGYAPPPDACPTFRGLYYGLAEFERDMHEHVHLENNILFPRAQALTRAQ